jgi:hypothetical protein
MLIELKYFGPTNHRGTRIKAICNQSADTYNWNYALNTDDNYLQAARLLWHEVQKKNGLDYNASLRTFKIHYLKGKIFVSIENKGE